MKSTNFESELALGEEVDPSVFPELYNLSAAFLFRFLPRPHNPTRPEFIYLPVGKGKQSRNYLKPLEVAGIIGQWNFAWESAQLRRLIMPSGLESRRIRKCLPFLDLLEERNVYLFPDTEKRFDAHVPLYAMLPATVLGKFGLPSLTRLTWPSLRGHWGVEKLLPSDFRRRLSLALAARIWPLIDGGSSLSAFSRNEPLHLLAHNVDFWLPHATRVVEQRLSSSFEYVEIENEKDRLDLETVRRETPQDEAVEFGPCRKGGYAWCGEEETQEVVSEMVESADSSGQLRGLIDAIRSNRVEEDFSERWSFAREDFERKLYHKRSRVRVKFVELSEAEGVLGPDSEISTGLLWQNFFALLDVKEKQIVVCLARGTTSLTEIAQELGYANHSPSRSPWGAWSR